MPAGAVYPAGCRSPRGWFGWLTSAGCVVSMRFTVSYSGLMVMIGLVPLFGYGAVEGRDFSLTWRLGSLIIGFPTTWHAWRWLKC